jgi:hypothetical protein
MRIPVLLLALSLAACEPRQPEEVPAPPPSPDNPAPSPAQPATSPTAPADPASAPAAPVQPAPSAPAPTEPSAAPRPTAAVAPAVDSMAIARPGAKMSVAVDLRYQFDGAVLEGRPTTLQLAAISRVDGTNLRVEVKPETGVETSRGAMSAQKVDAAGVYRQQLSVTRRAGAPGNLRVLVTMDMPEGTAFGYFTIPFDADRNRSGNTAQKSDSVKQR